MNMSDTKPSSAGSSQTNELYHAKLINFKPSVTLPTASEQLVVTSKTPTDLVNIYDDLTGTDYNYTTTTTTTTANLTYDDDDTDIYSYGEPRYAEIGAFTKLSSSPSSTKPTLQRRIINPNNNHHHNNTPSLQQRRSNEKLLYKLLMNSSGGGGGGSTAATTAEEDDEDDDDEEEEVDRHANIDTRTNNNGCFSSSSTSSGLSCSSSSVLSASNNTTPSGCGGGGSSSSSSASSQLANSISMSSLVKTTPPPPPPLPPQLPPAPPNNNALHYSLFSAQISKKSSPPTPPVREQSKFDTSSTKPNKKILTNKQITPGIIVLKPNNSSNQLLSSTTNHHHHNNTTTKTNHNHNHHHHAFDSTLLTPLTKKPNNHHHHAPSTPSPSSSSSFNSSCYFAQPQQSLNHIESDSSARLTTTTSTSTSTTQTRHIGPKSTSASYLLSKISSIANLTMPKNSSSSSSSSSSAPARKSITSLSQTSGGSNQQQQQQHQLTNTLMGNLANKLLGRKLSGGGGQQLDSSSGVVHVEMGVEANVTKRKTIRAMKSSSTTSTSSGSNSSFLNNGSGGGERSGRSSLKKRSQSIQAAEKVTSPQWFYNENDDYWYSNTHHSPSLAVPSTTVTTTNQHNQHDEIMLKSIGLIKRNKPLLTTASSSSSCTSSSQTSMQSSPNSSLHNTTTSSSSVHHSPNNSCSTTSSNSSASPKLGPTTPPELTQLRLTPIQIKFLTLIELKYLKQVCFNRAHKQLEQLVKLKQAQAREQNGGGSSSIRLHIPKDESMAGTQSSNPFGLKSATKRSKSVDFRFFEDLKENYFHGSGNSSNSSSNSSELVFGQSLYKCILNDLKQSQRGKTTTSTSTGTKKSKQQPVIASKYDLTLLSSINNNETVPTDERMLSMLGLSIGSEASASANNEIYFNNKRNSVLFEALDLKNLNVQNGGGGTKSKTSSDFLSSFAKTSAGKMGNSSNNSGLPSSVNNHNLAIRSEGLVPNIVKSCCKHISEYGLEMVGIFRIDSSKKRIKELKQMYDTGHEVILNDLFNPNDAACLLKEYLRSLPEPLLTRDLYSGFIAASKITDASKKFELVRSLIFLLPVPNRDTLELILKLLDKVRLHSEAILINDTSSSSSSPPKQIGGNRMDATNLATVFGPNLLQKHKINASSSQYHHHDPSHNAADYDDISPIISIIKYMIENHAQLFTLDAALHNELIQTLAKVEHPSEVNAILTRKIVGQVGIVLCGSKQQQPIGEESSSTSSYSSSSNELDRIMVKKPTTTTMIKQPETDFIDAGLNTRTSRTKLHKITNNLNFTNVEAPVPPKIELIKSYKQRPSDQFYNTRQSRPNDVKENNSECPSSILLMIQSQSSTSNHRRLSEQCNNQQQRVMNGGVVGNFKMSNGNNQQHQQQQNLLNSTTAANMICAKYFEKNKFNVIGEQETLV